MATQLQICNIAILDAGGNVISAVPDGNKVEGILCDMYWAHVVDFVLAEHPWNFAKKWVDLTQNASYAFVDDLYEYAWVVPSDFIRFSDQENRGSSKIDFARRDSHFLTNTDAFEIEYIFRPADVTDASTYPPWYVDALAAQLSARIAPKLARKGSKQIDWDARYQYKLSTAKHMNAPEDDQSTERKTRHTNSNDTWITARE